MNATYCKSHVLADPLEIALTLLLFTLNIEQRLCKHLLIVKASLSASFSLALQMEKANA